MKNESLGQEEMAAILGPPVAKPFVKPAPEEPTPDLKQCPFCKESVFRAATKCRYCGSEI